MNEYQARADEAHRHLGRQRSVPAPGSSHRNSKLPAGTTSTYAGPAVELLLTTVQEMSRTIESAVAQAQAALEDEQDGGISTEELREVLVGELAYLTAAAKLARSDHETVAKQLALDAASASQ